MKTIQDKLKQACDKMKLINTTRNTIGNSNPCTYTEIVYKPVYWTTFNNIVR